MLLYRYLLGFLGLFGLYCCKFCIVKLSYVGGMRIFVVGEKGRYWIILLDKIVIVWCCLGGLGEVGVWECGRGCFCFIVVFDLGIL